MSAAISKAVAGNDAATPQVVADSSTRGRVARTAGASKRAAADKNKSPLAGDKRPLSKSGAETAQNGLAFEEVLAANGGPLGALVSPFRVAGKGDQAVSGERTTPAVKAPARLDRRASTPPLRGAPPKTAPRPRPVPVAALRPTTPERQNKVQHQGATAAADNGAIAATQPIYQQTAAPASSAHSRDGEVPGANRTTAPARSGGAPLSGAARLQANESTQAGAMGALVEHHTVHESSARRPETLARTAPISSSTPSSAQANATEGLLVAPAPAPSPTVAVTAHEIATPLPGVASQLLQVINLAKPTTSGMQSISVALFPQSLGTVRATLSHHNGELVVRLAPVTLEAEHAIRRSLPELQSSLSSNGTSVSVMLVNTHGHSASGEPGLKRHFEPNEVGPATRVGGTPTNNEHARLDTGTSPLRSANSAVLDLLL